MIIKGKTDVIIIQKDTYQKRIKLDNIDNTTIEGVYVSCKELELSQKTTYDGVNGVYVFELQPSDTEMLATGDYTYDITLKLTTDDVFTLIYKGNLKVLPKTNSVNYA